MKYVVLGLCAVTVVLGGIALITPTHFAGIMGALETPSGLWIASALRIVFGIALYAAAPSSHAPKMLRNLGVIFIAAGLLIPILGRRRLARTTELFLSGGPWVIRSWGGVAILFGVSVGYAVLP